MFMSSLHLGTFPALIGLAFIVSMPCAAVAQSPDPFQAAPAPVSEPAKPATRSHAVQPPQRVVIQRVIQRVIVPEAPTTTRRTQPAPVDGGVIPQGYAPSPGTAPVGSRQFDGNWLATLNCQDSGPARGFGFQLIGNVTSGHFRGQKGVMGQPGGHNFDGVIQPDGHAVIVVNGLTGDTKYNIDNAPAGQSFVYQVSAQFTSNQGTGTRAGGRACTMNFVKQ
jgi:hypothetical protein